jgi:hypothetical protein
MKTPHNWVEISLYYIPCDSFAVSMKYVIQIVFLLFGIALHAEYNKEVVIGLC